MASRFPSSRLKYGLPDFHLCASKSPSMNEFQISIYLMLLSYIQIWKLIDVNMEGPTVDVTNDLEAPTLL